MPEREDDAAYDASPAVAPGTALRDGLERILRGNTGGADRARATTRPSSRCAPAASCWTSSSPPPGCASWQDGRRGRARHRRHADPAGRRSSWCPTRRSRPRSPAPGTAPRSGSPSRPATRSSRSASRCGSSACTSTAGGYVLEDSAAILSRANQALATLERYKLRLDEVSRHAVRAGDRGPGHRPGRDRVAQRLEMVRRIADEIDGLRRRARHRRPAARPCSSTS